MLSHLSHPIPLPPPSLREAARCWDRIFHDHPALEPLLKDKVKGGARVLERFCGNEANPTSCFPQPTHLLPPRHCTCTPSQAQAPAPSAPSPPSSHNAPPPKYTFPQSTSPPAAASLTQMSGKAAGIWITTLSTDPQLRITNRGFAHSRGQQVQVHQDLPKIFPRPPGRY